MLRTWVVVTLLAVMTAACASAPSGRQAIPQESGATARPARTLVAVSARAPNSLAAKAVGQQSGGAATYLSRRLFNADLTLLDDEGLPRPYLAEALPELITPTWRVFPDGRMETTYRLKPGLVWHNGMPLTGEDFAFGWRLYATPELGVASTTPINLIEDVSVPDSLTVVFHWKRPYPQAGGLESVGTGATGVPPLPKAILEAAYAAGSPDLLFSQAFWTREYVGLGPFRVLNWEPGAFIEAAAFERHALGAPKIQRLRLLFMSDSNAAMAAIIAGDVLLAADDAIRVGQVRTVLRELGQGRGAAVMHPNQWRNARFQLRPDYAKPRANRDGRVRQALAYAIDKEPLNEAVYDGQSLAADSMVSPLSPAGRAVDAAIAKYPFDLRRAEQLMGLAGFTRGADGFYTSPEGRYLTELKTNAASDNEAEMSIMASGWRQGGFDVQEAVLSAVLSQDNEARSTYSGIFSANTNAGIATVLDLSSAIMTRPETRWQGGNRGGYVNPEYDRLADALTAALDRSEQTRLLIEMMKIYAEDLPAIPLFFRAQAWVHVSDLRGPRLFASESNMSWAIHEWELR